MTAKSCALPTVIVRAPFSAGQMKPGVASAPKELIDSGLLTDSLAAQQLQYSIDGIEESTVAELEATLPRQRVQGVNNLSLVSEFNRQLNAVLRRVAPGHKVVTIGGDHSIAIGSISGLCAVYSGLKVVWIDAHADINTLRGTVSGNLHGCPVAFLMGLEDSQLDWLKPCLAPSNIVYVGLRDVEPQEARVMSASGIKAFYMEDVQTLGIEETVRQVVEFVGDAPVHVSLDVDGLDPDYMGATGTPVAGGLTVEEVEKLFQALKAKRLVSLDVVEVNPEEGSAQDRRNTLAFTTQLIGAFLAP